MIVFIPPAAVKCDATVGCESFSGAPEAPTLIPLEIDRVGSLRSADLALR